MKNKYRRSFLVPKVVSCSPELAFYLYRGGFAFCFNLMTTIYSIYQIEMAKLSPLQLVLVGTVLEASCFLFEIPTGIVADLYSRKLSMLLGLVIMGIGIFLGGVFPAFIVILLSQTIWGAGATFLSGADMAWLSGETSGKDVKRTFIVGMQVYQVFSALGVIASIALAVFKVSYPIIASGLLFVLLALLLLLIMPETNFKPLFEYDRPFFKKHFQPVALGMKHIFNCRFLLPFFITILLGGLYNEGLDRLWVYRLTKDIGLVQLFHLNRLYWFALINIVLLIINFFVLKLIKNKVEKYSVRSLYGLVLMNNIVLLSSMVLFSLTTKFYFALLAFWVVMAARNINEPLNIIIVNHTVTDDKIRATVLSMKGQMDQVGQILGGICIGMVANAFSVSIGLLCSSTVVIAIIIILFFLVGKRHNV